MCDKRLILYVCDKRLIQIKHEHVFVTVYSKLGRVASMMGGGGEGKR